MSTERDADRRDDDGHAHGDDVLRRVQRVELEILHELARRCEAESLRWFVIGGTLLGAARHRGFIPWDDDIDVGMPRPDYERFQELCLRSEDRRFAWQSASTDAGYPFMFGKLMRSGTHVVEPVLAHLEMRHAIYVDVFPLDGAPGPSIARRAHGLAFKLAVTALGARIRRTGLRRWASLAFRLVPRTVSIGAIDRLARAFPYDGSAFVVNASGAWGYERECQPRSRFEPATTLPFEDMDVPVPARWDEYLSRVYGDYHRLPPPEQRRPRHALAIVSLGADDAADQPSAARGPRIPWRRALVARLGLLAVRAGFALGSLRPPRPYVLFAGGDGSRVSGNLLFIRRALRRRTPPVPSRVIGYRIRGGLGGRLLSAAEAVRAGYHLAAARLVIVDDFFFPMYAIRPRPGTTRVQVWHAAGAFKKFGFSVLDKSFGADEAMVRLVPIHSNYDLCLVSSSAATPHYMEAFRLPRERFSSAIGLPRTDIFWDEPRRTRAAAAIRERYGLTDARVLLYAPTFRGTNPRDARYDDALDLAALRETLGAGWVVLLRLHPFVRRAVTIGEEMAGFAVDVSDWPDMNELMLVADLLVTDYSSAIFEFALLERPVAFLAPDLGDYEGERGFYLDIPEDLPGPLFETTAALAEWVREGVFDLDRVRAFARRWFDMADGHATERFVERVVLPALAGVPIDIETEPGAGGRLTTPPGGTGTG